MNNEIQDLVYGYYDWLKSQTKIVEYGEYHEITTPFFDFYNDAIQVYAKIENENILITDDNYTLSNLDSAGVQLNPNRMKTIEKLCQNYGVQLRNNTLFIRGNKKDFSNMLHYFIQCILKVDDMNLTSSGRSISYFLSDVIDFFDQNDIYYTENPIFIGKSGLSHSYDFSFQRTKEKPERLCRILNNASKANMQSTIFSWEDTKPSRKIDSEFIIIYNDKNKVESGVLAAFENYDIKSLPWTKKENIIEELT